MQLTIRKQRINVLKNVAIRKQRIMHQNIPKQKPISDEDYQLMKGKLSQFEGVFLTARNKRKVVQVDKKEISLLKKQMTQIISDICSNDENPNKKLNELRVKVEIFKEFSEGIMKLESAQRKLQDLERAIELNTKASQLLLLAESYEEIVKINQEINEYVLFAKKGILDGILLCEMSSRLQEAQANFQDLQNKKEEEILDYKNSLSYSVMMRMMGTY